MLSSSSFTNSAGKQVVFGEVLNNTGDRQESVQVTATFYNAAHEVLRTASATTYVNVMPSRTRSPFKISINKPAGYDHYDVAVVTNQRSVEPLVGNLNISSSSITSAPGPSFKGTFKNANSFSAHAVNSIVTLFDAWATVINVRSDATSPTFMPANSTATYSSTFTSHYTGWNYGYVYLEGTR